MSVSDCGECKKLLDEAAAAIKLQLEAISSASGAVQHGEDQDFDILNQAVVEARMAQVEACERYENHLASHAARTMAAGGSEPL